MNKKENTTSTNEILIYIAVCIALVVFAVASFPQFGIEITQNQIFLLVVVLVLLLFRHFGRIEILGFLRLSKVVEEVKKETREIRSSLQSLALSIASSRATAIVNLGGVLDAAAEEAREIESEIPSIPSLPDLSDQMRFDVMNITQYIERGHFIAAFATLRNRIETELRDILRFQGEEAPRATTFHLARRVGKLNIVESATIEAILVVNNTANTILHSAAYEQTIPMEKARYISELGIRALYELRRVRNELASRQ